MLKGRVSVGRRQHLQWVSWRVQDEGRIKGAHRDGEQQRVATGGSGTTPRPKAARGAASPNPVTAGGVGKVPPVKSCGFRQRNIGSAKISETEMKPLICPAQLEAARRRNQVTPSAGMSTPRIHHTEKGTGHPSGHTD